VKQATYKKGQNVVEERNDTRNNTRSRSGRRSGGSSNWGAQEALERVDDRVDEVGSSRSGEDTLEDLVERAANLVKVVGVESGSAEVEEVVQETLGDDAAGGQERGDSINESGNVSGRNACGVSLEVLGRNPPRRLRSAVSVDVIWAVGSVTGAVVVAVGLVPPRMPPRIGGSEMGIGSLIPRMLRASASASGSGLATGTGEAMATMGRRRRKEEIFMVCSIDSEEERERERGKESRGRVSQ
jgi:hypothetical protein